MSSYFQMYPYGIETDRLIHRKNYLQSLIAKEAKSPEPRQRYMELLKEAETHTIFLVNALIQLAYYESKLP